MTGGMHFVARFGAALITCQMIFAQAGASGMRRYGSGLKSRNGAKMRLSFTYSMVFFGGAAKRAMGSASLTMSRPNTRPSMLSRPRRFWHVWSTVSSRLAGN